MCGVTEKMRKYEESIKFGRILRPLVSIGVFTLLT